MMNTKISYSTKFALVLLAILYCVSFNAMAAFSSRNSENKFISYTDVGKGEPLVLIHAFPTDKRLWEPQLALKQRGQKKGSSVIVLIRNSSRSVNIRPS